MHWIKTYAGLGALWAVAALPFGAAASVPPFAEEHEFVDEMVVSTSDLFSHLDDPNTIPFFERPIEHTIHQIWFGNPCYFDYERTGQWQRVAERYGYSYHLWTEDDDALLSVVLGPEVIDYVDYLRQRRRYDGASDVLRYFLVKHFGGLYFDVDVPAPTLHGELLDPNSIWPLRGLVVSSENTVREVRNSAFFAQNHMIMAAAGHPALRTVTDDVLLHRKIHADEVARWAYGANFATGQTRLSRSMQGPFTMLRLSHLAALGIDAWPDLGPYRRETCAKFHARTDQPERTRHVHIDR